MFKTKNESKFKTENNKEGVKMLNYVIGTLLYNEKYDKFTLKVNNSYFKCKGFFTKDMINNKIQADIAVSYDKIELLNIGICENGVSDIAITTVTIENVEDDKIWKNGTHALILKNLNAYILCNDEIYNQLEENCKVQCNLKCIKLKYWTNVLEIEKIL